MVFCVFNVIFLNVQFETVSFFKKCSIPFFQVFKNLRFVKCPDKNVKSLKKSNFKEFQILKIFKFRKCSYLISSNFETPKNGGNRSVGCAPMEHVRACWGYAKWVYIATMLFYTGKFG
jgi:hypothetical protein